MRIDQALVVPAWGGYFNDDLAAIRAGAKKDGFTYVGEVRTPGFSQVRHPTEAASIVLLLSNGQHVCGDFLTVQYAGAGGRSRRFSHEGQIAPLKELAPQLEGVEINSFLDLCQKLERFDVRSDTLNRTAANYGISQALLLAVAAAKRLTPAEVLAEELGRQVSSKLIPIYVQCGEDRHHGVDKAVIRRADVLPHGLINSIDVLGAQGEKLQEYVAWIVTRIRKFGSGDYRPEIHIDGYGLLGQIFEHDANRIATYIATLADVARPYAFCMETPVLMDIRGGQIELFAAIRRELKRLGSGAQLIVDEWANDIHDIRAFIAAGATDMVNVKSPDLGSIHNAAQAILECNHGGVRPILGGSSNDTDQSGRVMCHVALATSPAWILARPGMGMDEGFQIVHNEMARTLAIIASRNRKAGASS